MDNNYWWQRPHYHRPRSCSLDCIPVAKVLHTIDIAHILMWSDVLIIVDRLHSKVFAMSKRVFWLPTIGAILGLLGTGIMSPALARGGGGGGGGGSPALARGGGGGGGGGHGLSTLRFPARISPILRTGRFGTPGIVGGPRNFQNNVFRRGGAFPNSGLAGIWPYPWWPTDTMPAQVGTAVPSAPQVIVISSSNYAQGRIPPTPGDPPDYSYVPGCQAIPNGYHCETPVHEAPAH